MRLATTIIQVAILKIFILKYIVPEIHFFYVQKRNLKSYFSKNFLSVSKMSFLYGSDPNMMPESMSDTLVTVLLPSKDPFGSSSVQGFES